MGVHRTIVDSQMVAISSSNLAVTTAGSTTIIPSVGTGSIYLTDFIFSNGATAGNFKLTLSSGTGTIVVGPVYIAINNSVFMSYETPLQIPSNTNVIFTTSTSTTASCNVSFYTAP